MKYIKWGFNFIKLGASQLAKKLKSKIPRKVATGEIKRVKLILNPVAGEGKVKQTLQRIRKILEEKDPNIKLSVFLSGDRGELTPVAREAGEEKFPLVIVAGGDGAINEAVNGIAGTETALGIIPLGTGNVFAREMGIPLNIEGACQTIVTGETKRIDLGKLGDKYFIWMAGVGLDAMIAQEVPWDVKDSIGVFAYFIFAIRHIRDVRKHFEKLKVDMEIQFDDEEPIKRRVLTAIVGNATTYNTGKLKINSKESIDDGYFDVMIGKKPSYFWIVRVIVRFIFGKFTYYEDLKWFDAEIKKAKKIKIMTDPPTPVHIDGEVVGGTPCEFEIVPKSLSLIIPKKK